MMAGEWDVAAQEPAAPNAGDWTVVSHQPVANNGFDLGDVLKSGATGLAKGVTGLAGLPGDIGRAEEGALSWLGNKVGLGDSVQHGLDWYNQHIGNYIAPSSQQLNSAVQSHILPYHEPQTIAGKYAQTIGEFAPAALAGPEGIAPKIASVVAPAIASEAAGQATQGTGLEPVARTVGAVLGGGAAGLAERTPSLIKSLVKQPSDIERATAYIGQKLQSAGLTPSTAGPTLDAATATGKPLIAAEVLGKPAQVGIGALARREGATADALGGAMASRGADASNRILGDYAASAGIHPSAAQGDIEQLVQSGRLAADPIYKQALSQGATWSSDLAALSNRPAIQKAMAQAAEDLRNAGKDPSAFGFTGQDPITGKFIQQPRPTAEAWDLIKKNVGASVDRDPFGKPLPDSVSPKNYNIGVATRDLTGALKKAIPGYGDALAASGDYLSSKAAFDRGQSMVLDSKVTAKQLADHIAKLSPSEVEAFKGGIANKLFNLTQNNRLNLKLFDAPIVQQKLSASLGPQNAQKFLDALKVEKGMANFARLRVPGAGSPTAEYNAEMAAQDANPTIQAVMTHGGNVVQHGVVGGIAKSLGSHAQNLASAYATRGMPIEARNEAGRILMMSPADFKAYLGQIQKTGSLPKQSQSLLPYFTQAMLGSALAAPAVSSQAQ